MGCWASDRETPAAKSLYRSISLDDYIFAVVSIRLISPWRVLCAASYGGGVSGPCGAHHC
jgi:hypothetical protein